VLDVPYLAQPARLCGGAALAMVLRYWGERDVVAQDFAALVDPKRDGIPADALAAAVSRRGWQSFPAVAGETDGADRIREQVNRGRPVMALVEARPDLYHFVVVVGVTDDAVVLHDPARAPFQVVPRAEFDASWARARRWMLLVLPPVNWEPQPAASAASVRTGVTVPADTPCAALVSRSVTAARDGDTSAARQGLTAATVLCPQSAAGWRELAGSRFLEQRYDESQRLAERAVHLDPADRHAWQIVATSRYLNGNLTGALEAWNRVGEPRTDLVAVTGTDRTPHQVVVNLVDLPPRELLTADAFVRAQRRLNELPVSNEATLRYEPTGEGRAAVGAVIKERRLLPNDRIEWGAWGAETLLLREIRVDVPGWLGAGENLRARYRWAANRPRVRLEFGVPAPGPVPGIASIDVLWERQAYGSLLPGEAPLRQDRRRAGGSLSDWPVSWLRWQAGAAIDHIDARRFVAVSAQASTQWLDDRIVLNASAERWIPTGDGDPFVAGGVNGAWRWTADRTRPTVLAIAGAAVATESAPFAVWSGASTTPSRGAFLRAHPIHESGIVTGEVFGRRLVFTTIEYQRPVWASRYGLATLAIFVDSARAWQRREPAPSRWQTDVGTGVRFGEPDAAGLVRLDVAYGLRDRQVAISAGYVSSWGQ
jgi:hypothetical protein